MESEGISEFLPAAIRYQSRGGIRAISLTKFRGSLSPNSEFTGGVLQLARAVYILGGGIKSTGPKSREAAESSKTQGATAPFGAIEEKLGLVRSAHKLPRCRDAARSSTPAATRNLSPGSDSFIREGNTVAKRPRLKFNRT